MIDTKIHFDKTRKTSIESHVPIRVQTSTHMINRMSRINWCHCFRVAIDDANALLRTNIVQEATKNVTVLNPF